MNVFIHVDPVLGTTVFVVAADTAKEAKKLVHEKYKNDHDTLRMTMKYIVFKQLEDTQYQGVEAKVLFTVIE